VQKLLLWGPFRILVIIDGLPFMFLGLDIFQSIVVNGWWGHN